MPTSQKPLLTRTYYGDQYIEYNADVWSNQIGDTKFVSFASNKAELHSQGFTQGIAPSNFEQLKIAFLDCIEKKDAERLGDLLCRDFIYEKIREYTDKMSDDLISVENTYEIYNVRPVLEAYFKDNLEDLSVIISAVVNKNDLNLMAKFMIAIDAADLFMKRLGEWNEEIKKDALIQIEKLLQHGKKLVNKGDTESVLKGNAVITLANDIKEMVASRGTERPTILSGLFDNIQFKFELAKLLHTKDELLTHHRGYKEEIVNGFSTAFTLSAASARNKAQSGQLFFKVKTKSQEKVESIERSLFPPLKR